MATAQVKQGLLILLVAAVIVNTANGLCDPNKCNYVVDVLTGLGDPGLTVYFSAANWEVIKVPGVNGNFGPAATYQFSVEDTNCWDPCLLKLKVESGGNLWVPTSVRIRGFRAGDINFDRTFSVDPPNVVTSSRNFESSQC